MQEEKKKIKKAWVKRRTKVDQAGGGQKWSSWRSRTTHISAWKTEGLFQEWSHRNVLWALHSLWKTNGGFSESRKANTRQVWRCSEKQSKQTKDTRSDRLQSLQRCDATQMESAGPAQRAASTCANTPQPRDADRAPSSLTLAAC